MRKTQATKKGRPVQITDSFETEFFEEKILKNLSAKEVSFF
jgi:hypothetical protein